MIWVKALYNKRINSNHIVEIWVETEKSPEFEVWCRTVDGSRYRLYTDPNGDNALRFMEKLTTDIEQETSQYNYEY